MGELWERLGGARVRVGWGPVPVSGPIHVPFSWVGASLADARPGTSFADRLAGYQLMPRLVLVRALHWPIVLTAAFVLHTSGAILVWDPLGSCGPRDY